MQSRAFCVALGFGMALQAAAVRPALSAAVEPLIGEILASYRDEAKPAGLRISYPQDGTLFPPEIVPPTFRWDDPTTGVDTWLVTLAFPDEAGRLNFVARKREWTPAAADWERIKKRSLEKDARAAVVGVHRAASRQILSSGRMTFRTSHDPVGAPIFYREVNLPFSEAAKDPTNIRWRFGTISSAQPPPVILERLPVCGNCHSFPADGKTLAMDVDYANSKGSYVMTRTAEEMVLATSDIITWDDYKREDGQQTFGLLSQISPDGRFVASTVKDKSVFVPKPDLEFSQLFFPIKGILACYDRQTRTFQSLPGADDPRFVQSNPSWSPDGKYLVFARSPAYQLRKTPAGNRALLTPEECDEFLKEGKPFQFELYRMAFNGGQGGPAEPLAGASNNGMSNFFARYSPDGKWIVFCKARNYMLLQPDSELYIVPAEGGSARRLECNTRRMNSWHSWSPNGRWLVFSSKAHSAYTQLFLTHIDEQGRSTPPVVLAQFTASDRAANIPEFVNVAPEAIKRIREKFLDDNSHVRAADAFYRGGDLDGTIREYKQALQLNPSNVRAHQRLGLIFAHYRKQPKEAMAHFQAALQLDPNDPLTLHDLGIQLAQLRDYERAIGFLQRAVRTLPPGMGKEYDGSSLRFNLGGALLLTNRVDEAAVQLAEAAGIEPRNADIQYLLALALARQGKTDEAAGRYSQAVALRPEVDQSMLFHDVLAQNYSRAGRTAEAIASEEKALALAHRTGNAAAAQAIRQRLDYLRQLQAVKK